MIKIEDLKIYLSSGMVARKYGINRGNVVAMCERGLQIKGDDAVKTCLGWLIHPHAAKRVWGKIE